MSLPQNEKQTGQEIYYTQTSQDYKCPMEGDLPERVFSLTGMQEQSSLTKITLEHGKWSRSLPGLNNGISKCLG